MVEPGQRGCGRSSTPQDSTTLDIVRTSRRRAQEAPIQVRVLLSTQSGAQTARSSRSLTSTARSPSTTARPGQVGPADRGPRVRTIGVAATSATFDWSPSARSSRSVTRAASFSVFDVASRTPPFGDPIATVGARRPWCAGTRTKLARGRQRRRCAEPVRRYDGSLVLGDPIPTGTGFTTEHRRGARSGAPPGDGEQRWNRARLRRPRPLRAPSRCRAGRQAAIDLATMEPGWTTFATLTVQGDLSSSSTADARRAVGDTHRRPEAAPRVAYELEPRQQVPRRRRTTTARCA